jgi:hypothetical protein
MVKAEASQPTTGSNPDSTVGPLTCPIHLDQSCYHIIGQKLTWHFLHML